MASRVTPASRLSAVVMWKEHEKDQPAPGPRKLLTHNFSPKVSFAMFEINIETVIPANASKRQAEDEVPRTGPFTVH